MNMQERRLEPVGGGRKVLGDGGGARDHTARGSLHSLWFSWWFSSAERTRLAPLSLGMACYPFSPPKRKTTLKSAEEHC